MAIVSHKHRVVFFPMAKNCSTSVKHLFYGLETGMPFRKAKKKYGLLGHVHKYYPTQTKEEWLNIFEAYDSIVIVRDPIKRFLSAYGNRIVHRKVLETTGYASKLIRAAGFPLQPSLDEFIQNLEFYCKVSSYMKNHIAPQETIVGKSSPRSNMSTTHLRYRSSRRSCLRDVAGKSSCHASRTGARSLRFRI